MFRKSFTDRIIDFFIVVLLIGVSIIMLFPFIHVLGNSLMTPEEYFSPGIKFIPFQGITFKAYESVLLKNNLILVAYKNTLFLAIVGTGLSLIVTTITGYVLSREKLKGRAFITFLFILTMLIQGGLIPRYLVVRSLGLMNTLWSMILPVTINTFFLIILKNFFANIPVSLEESAYIDGANEIYILFKIFIPLSTPAMVTIGLFYTVNYWNSFFLGVLFLTDARKWPLQLLLRNILISSNMAELTGGSDYAGQMTYALKMASIIVAIVPIICVYPFLQKYFTKGILIGAVKG
jgi:putative aldouronate transport system permease protein